MRSRYEEESSDTIKKKPGNDSRFVTIARNDFSCRNGHEEIATIDNSLYESRTCLTDGKRVLKMLIKHIKDAVSKSPQEKK
jgi:hypothetical protein